MSDVTKILDADELNKYLSASKSIEDIYPKITERRANLAMVGVNARTYNHWRNLGLVGEPAIKGQAKQWVRLNIYDYVWLEIVKVVREFGMPLETIKRMRELLELNFIEELKGQLEGFADFLKEQSDMSDVRIEQEMAKFQYMFDNTGDVLPEEKHLLSILGSLIHKSLLTDEKTSIIIYKTERGFEFGSYTFSTISEFTKMYSNWFVLPHLTIPLGGIIEKFMNEPKNQVNLEVWGFIDKNEKKVLETLRNADFNEIIIKKPGDSQEFSVEVISSGNITDLKAKEIRKILGLNQYQEITIKYRNDKTLYFKNKKRI